MTQNNNSSSNNKTMSVDEILHSVQSAMKSTKKNLANNFDEDVLELTNVDEEVNENIEIKNSDQESLNSSIEENIHDRLVSLKSAKETTNIISDFAKTAKELIKDHKKHKFTPLEETIIQMIRPELSKWLDINLPIIVREIVEQEIKDLIINDFQKK